MHIVMVVGIFLALFSCKTVYLLCVSASEAHKGNAWSTALTENSNFPILDTESCLTEGRASGEQLLKLSSKEQGY